jgi:hypothetical protein
MILFGEAVALTAQNMGRTGSISTNPGVPRGLRC